jgi:hypothetical protein
MGYQVKRQKSGVGRPLPERVLPEREAVEGKQSKGAMLVGSRKTEDKSKEPEFAKKRM